MIDVHAPEHRVSGTRDFFVHLFTITCGLLIALGLEAGVEALHHRHQRREAEEKILAEIRHNKEFLEKTAPQVLAERKSLQAFVLRLRDEEMFKTMDGQQMSVQFNEEEIPDSAWRTASSTGVLEYLPYDEVERFAGAYREQALLQDIARKALEDYLELAPQLTTYNEVGDRRRKPTFAELHEALPAAERALGHMNGILAAGQGTLESYKTALSEK